MGKINCPLTPAPPLPREWQRPDFLCTMRSSLTTDCLSLCRCRCPVSSAARCHGDHGGGAVPKMDVSQRFLSPQRTAGRQNWSVPSVWGRWTLCQSRGEVLTVNPPKKEVCLRSWLRIGWRRSLRGCCGHLQQQMCCS